jgi:hypothetical protein
MMQFPAWVDGHVQTVIAPIRRGTPASRTVGRLLNAQERFLTPSRRASEQRDRDRRARDMLASSPTTVRDDAGHVWQLVTTPADLERARDLGLIEHLTSEMYPRVR